MSVTLEQWTADANDLDFYFKKLEDAQVVAETVPIDEPKMGLDIRCGPILRFIGCLENGTKNYRGSILLVLKDETTTADPQIDFVAGPLNPADLNNDLIKGTFPAEIISKRSGYTFWRFNIELELLDDFEQKVRYTVNNIQSFDFYLPKAITPMNIVSYSCNGFSLSTVTDDFKGSLWYDVLRHHHEKQRYHVMLGGGDQVYCDAIKNSSKEFNSWMTERNPLKKAKAKLTKEMTDSFHNFYINQYLEWFGKGYWKGTNGSTLQPLYPLAMASIPSINIFDDHDIIDGFGSYHDTTMSNAIFKGVGSVAYDYYMLFQHQTSLDEKCYENDPSWILGKSKGPYIEEKSHSVFAKLGSGIGFLGLDCRTERKLKQIVTNDTYSVVFNRLQQEVKNDPNIKHLLVLLGVPIAYPRLVWLETLLSSPILIPIRKLAQKGIIAKGLVNEFDGSVEVLDDLNDHWCSHNHKHERNALVAKLQKFGAANGVRITILSGDVHLAAVGRFKSKLHLHHFFNREKYTQINDKVRNEPEHDPRLMFNIISSAIVNAPPPSAMATLLNKRSGIHHFDMNTNEDMVPIFQQDVDDELRNNKEFLNRRNWADIIPLVNSNLGYKVGDFKLPGPIGNEKILDDLDTSKNRDLYSKVTENCLVSTIHVEKDSKDLQSETKDYELIVSELVEKQDLKNVGVKN